jgi:tRNA dimethylallyltransferase
MTGQTAWPADGVLVIVGPTAAGKTPLAVHAAERLGAEIISADSRQVYQGFDLGTGKPSAEELRRVPHHLISCVPPERVLSAVEYAGLAEAALQDLVRRGKRACVVGGTGLWARALVDGLAPTAPPDPAVRAELANRAASEGLPALYEELARVDPESAARIEPADRVRILRALEIWRVSGVIPSAARKQIPLRPPKPSLWIGLDRPRAELFARAEARIDAWIAAGWLDEVRALAGSGLDANYPVWQALGYAHLWRVVQGQTDLGQAVALIKRDTRHYIKRQLTWFRAEARVHWLDAGSTAQDPLTQVLGHLRNMGWLE